MRGPNVKGQGQHMTKYGQKLQVWSHNFIQRYQVGNFVIQKHFWNFERPRSRSPYEQILAKLKIKSFGHNMTKYGTEYCFGVMTEADAHYKKVSDGQCVS